MNDSKIKNFISNYKDFKRIFDLFGTEFSNKTNVLFKEVEKGNCDQKTMDFALNLSESITSYKKIESSFFDPSKTSLEDAVSLDNENSKDYLEFIGLGSLVSSKNNGYGAGLYLNKQHGIFGGVISGLVMALFKENNSSDYIIWSIRASLVVATYFIDAPTFIFIGYDAYLLLLLYGLSFIFLSGDKTDEAIAFAISAEGKDHDTFDQATEFHPIVKEKLNAFKNAMNSVSMENYHEIKPLLANLSSILNKYKEKINNPAGITSFLNVADFVNKFGEGDIEYASDAIDSVKLTLNLWDKAKADNDENFSMMENVSAEINHLTNDTVFTSLSEGYKASLLKEGMMKEFREFVDEEDAPEAAVGFKSAIKDEDWDLAGLNYGYMFVLTQERRKEEEEARQEARMEAAKGAVRGAARGFKKGIRKN